ncbi:MAG: DNA-processing protein DprA [Candidatus Cardinium sp.]|uniref:DNA-processing protein DprA n=1 Tax=Cardinium endosymbiont of Dermatophagoides farinae TaxID=2597823 RepID=UPI0011844D2D|nr:DNA-processing protein DprA [Cardinium endosymbiont of Dermatophagoides farinae]TSJ81323.1 DNA-protecting protein DprA [Cardinium endosymbiont of Dermatophagoides farinae]UWW97386.1 MAG: DNA-processing protein DprA [Candidatus Cardinium sp.]
MVPLTEKHYRLALSLVPGIGCTWLKKLLAYFGSAQAVFAAAHKGNTLLPYKIAKAITSSSSLAQAEKVLQLHEAEAIQLLTTEEDSYPKRLLELPDGPSILYYKGQALLNQQRVVTIVGTRQLTSYGQGAITKFLEQLLPYQPLVVSGLAYGVDIWVHKQALEMGLTTVAVLPTSVNEIYLTAHKEIAMELCGPKGGLLTEYPIGSGLGAHTFVARNRILAGLADVTIVIEAKEKSGALITAYYANSYHREVFALPGSIYSATSAGCHRLIKRNQAHLLTHIDDLAYIMNWEVHHQPQTDTFLNHPLTASEQMVLEQLQQAMEPITIDALTYATALSPGALQAALLSLELQGLLRALPGKRFILAPMYKQ